MQSDAAALAAAYRLQEGASPAAARAAALYYAEGNGYNNDQIDNWVSVNIPPTTGPNAGDPTAAEVLVAEEPTSFFIHAIVPGTNTVKGRATAVTTDVPRDYGLLVLNENACSSYVQGGTGAVVVAGAGAMINSTCDDALVKGGGGLFTADGGVDVTGGVDEPYTGIEPDPRPYVPCQVDDPLADIPPPNLSDYPVRNGSAALADTLQVTGATDVSFPPGVYYGGMRLNCSCTITFQSGIYIMSGEGFTKTSTTNIEGDGVMIYVTKHPAEPPASPGDGFDFSGGGLISLTGPSSQPPCPLNPCPYEDIVFWQDASVTDDFHLAGNASGTTGTWYVPGANLTVTGGADFGTARVIVDTFTKTGNGDLLITYEAMLADIFLPLVLLSE